MEDKTKAFGTLGIMGERVFREDGERRAAPLLCYLATNQPMMHRTKYLLIFWNKRTYVRSAGLCEIQGRHRCTCHQKVHRCPQKDKGCVSHRASPTRTARRASLLQKNNFKICIFFITVSKSKTYRADFLAAVYFRLLG